MLQSVSGFLQRLLLTGEGEIHADPFATSRLYTRKGSMGPDKGIKCSVYERENCNHPGDGVGAGQWMAVHNIKYPGFASYGAAKEMRENYMTQDGPYSWRCQLDS
jgi:hypothetical protein